MTKHHVLHGSSSATTYQKQPSTVHTA